MNSKTFIDFDNFEYKEGDEFIRIVNEKNIEKIEAARFSQINTRSERNRKAILQQRKAAEERRLRKEARMNVKVRRALTLLTIVIISITFILYIGLSAYVYNEQSIHLALLCGAGIPILILCAYKALKLAMKFNILDV